MKKLILLVAVIAALLYGAGGARGLRQLTGMAPPAVGGNPAQGTDSQALRAAFEARQSGVQAEGEGVVAKLLADDTQGSRHQRFILTLAWGQTVLVAHNMDLAPRLDALKVGDTVSFNGVYEWNAQGGVIHWTHHDPAGQHAPGWLQHAGRTYQ